MSMFERAARYNYRFNYKGLCSVEDLWVMPLQDLDKIYQKLYSELKKQNEESLLKEKSKEDEILKDKINIVKYIVETRLEEKRKKEEEAARAAEKQEILGIIKEKKKEDLRNRPIEELEGLLKED